MTKFFRNSPLVRPVDCVNNRARLGDEAATYPRVKAGQVERRDTRKAMTKANSNVFTRRGLLSVFAATAAVAAPTYANAFGLLRGAGDIRRLKMYSSRTGESINTIYWIEGEYIKEALNEINHFMRDWRENAIIQMDPRNFDIIAATHKLLDTTEPYLMLSGYRTPKTNAMLRRHSRNVAKNSLHIKGEAADLRLKTRSVSQMAKAALACRAGGVGRYYRARFVHMDCGPVRTWKV